MKSFALLVVLLMAWSWVAATRTSCNCGWVNKGRIVGGKMATKHQFPWMAALWDDRGQKVYCGATIVTKHHAITAGHCGPYYHSTKSSLVVGLQDTSNFKKSDAAKIGVEELIVHPDFNISSMAGYDIAVAVTSSEIGFSPDVGPACFPYGIANLTGQTVVAMGWGKTGPIEGASSSLKYAKLTVMGREKCLPWVSSVTQLQGQICALGDDQGTCSGDSGGPLVWMDPDVKRYTLIGVTSFGTCAFPPPTVFTDVGAYVTWLEEVIREKKPQELCSKQ